jgi:hypothetical protein
MRETEKKRIKWRDGRVGDGLEGIYCIIVNIFLRAIKYSD